MKCGEEQLFVRFLETTRHASSLTLIITILHMLATRTGTFMDLANLKGLIFRHPVRCDQKWWSAQPPFCRLLRASKTGLLGIQTSAQQWCGQPSSSESATPKSARREPSGRH